jgi:cytochrome c-type biogenesis protein CcmF
MPNVGTFALYAALYISIIGAAISFVAGRWGQQRFVLASRFSAYAAFGAVSVASSVLMHALLTHDFSIQYVAKFSDKTMPLFYLIGSFWGGQAGSLLFWTSVVASTTAACVYVNRRSYQDFMPWVIAICLSVMAGLLAILCFGSNPFETYQVIADPTKGQGLNPLLQTPKMVMHPPSLLAGLATMTIPYAFAMAALITGNFSNAWVKAARKWIIVPWFFLSIGNMLGGMWAYEELGWGGYWAWDPVENAAFFPWLMTSALIHSIMIQERRGMLRRWNIALMISSFALTIFGTYITRSGLIQSVHSFAQSEIGDYFLALLVCVIAVSLACFAWRWKDLGVKKRLDSPASREAAFIFNNWMLVTMTVVVLFGTMWPKIKEGLFGAEVSIGPPWFNRWMVPLGILLLLLMGIGTIIPWRRTTRAAFKSQFLKPTLAALAIGPALVAAYWYGRGAALGVTPTPLDATYATLTVTFAVFAVTTMIADVWRAARARSAAHDESISMAIMQMASKQKRRYGGYIVHLGIVAAYIAFAGNALKIEQDVSLMPGESITIGDYTLTYERLRQETQRDKVITLADVSASRGGQRLYTLAPGQARFNARPNMPTSEIDIKTTPLEDLYVALVSFDRTSQAAAFKVFVAPFTWWFWFGGTILIFGTLLCLWPSRDELDVLRPSPGVFARAAGGVLVLASLSGAPLALYTYESHSEWSSAERLLLAQSDDAPDTRGAP